MLQKYIGIFIFIPLLGVPYVQCNSVGKTDSLVFMLCSWIRPTYAHFLLHSITKTRDVRNPFSSLHPKLICSPLISRQTFMSALLIFPLSSISGDKCWGHSLSIWDVLLVENKQQKMGTKVNKACVLVVFSNMTWRPKQWFKMGIRLAML